MKVSCSITEYERKKKKGIECAKCGSSEVLQQVSGFQVQTSRKVNKIRVCAGKHAIRCKENS